VIRARELLLHPIAFLSIAILVANDHWLKYAHPSVLTGKLSDVAGLTFFPILVLIVLDLAWPKHRAITVIAAPLVTALGFALVKSVPAATELYRHALGFLQSPLAPSPVEAVTDPTDLLALPCVAISIALARSRGFLSPAPVVAERRVEREHRRIAGEVL
jgi:hypothetical protein